MSHDPLTPPTPAGRVIGVALALTLVLTVFVLAFSWPAVTAEPRDLPVAVVGSDDAVAAFRDTLREAQPGTIELTEADDRADAVQAIRTRDVYGAVVLGDPAAGEAPEVLTASAASGVTHQLMTQLAAQAAAGHPGAGERCRAARAAGRPAGDGHRRGPALCRRPARVRLHGGPVPDPAGRHDRRHRHLAGRHRRHAARARRHRLLGGRRRDPPGVLHFWFGTIRATGCSTPVSSPCRSPRSRPPSPGSWRCSAMPAQRWALCS